MSIFNSILLNHRKKSTFNLNSDNKLSFEMGYLIPVKTMEVLPGDEIQMNVESFIRFAPMVAPVMQDFNLYLEAYFTPWRLLMSREYWELWNNPENNLTLPLMHVGMNSTRVLQGFTNVGTLWDYLGFPTREDVTAFGYTSGSAFPENDNESAYLALPFKAYQLIYNEYYRDQNLIDPVDILIDNVNINQPDQVVNLMRLRKRAFRKDYFTSALPNAQRGSDVTIPISGDVNINFDETPHGTNVFFERQHEGTSGNLTIFSRMQQASNEGSLNVSPQSGSMGFSVDNSANLSGEIANSTSPIQNLRTAMTVQGLLELFERAGGRLKERLLALWGTAPKDLTLQRPKFLGQSISPIVIGEVLQTSASTADGTAQGNMSGHGVGLNKGYLFRETFDEPGYITVMMSVIPRPSYFQGMPRKYSRRTFFDMANPQMAHLGEQEVKNGELMWLSSRGEEGAEDYDNNGVFGYQSRYAEYKFEPNEVHGDFQSSLLFWHGARKFDPNYPPALNKDFIEASTPEQIFAYSPEEGEQIAQRLYSQVNFDVVARRMLPYYGTPQFPVMP